MEAKSDAVSKTGVFMKQENRETASWFLFNLIKVTHTAFITFFIITLLFLLTMGNLGPRFVETSKLFKFPEIGLNMEPAINFVFWLSVTELGWSALCHTRISYTLLTGSSSLIDVFDRLFLYDFTWSSATRYLFKWALCDNMFYFINGLVFCLLKGLCQPSHLFLFLMLLHACSSLMVWCYWRMLLKAKEQSNTPNGKLKGTSTDGSVVILI